MKRRLRAPSPAFVTSLIALLVALGGTSYAAITLPKNSVGTKQLKKNAVTSPKIKNGAVTAAKINTKGLTVPNALHATSADNATNATNATNAANATHANSATQADNATTLGGLGVASFLPSSRLLTGSASANAAAGTEIFADSSVGVDVQVGTAGSPRLVNTNATTSIAVTGLDSLFEGATNHDNLLGRISRTVAPGSNTEFRLSTIGPSYVDVLVTRLDVASRSLHLTCALVNVPAPVSDTRISCLAVV
jgi:hypothetical protein